MVGFLPPFFAGTGDGLATICGAGPGLLAAGALTAGLPAAAGLAAGFAAAPLAAPAGALVAGFLDAWGCPACGLLVAADGDLTGVAVGAGDFPAFCAVAIVAMAAVSARI